MREKRATARRLPFERLTERRHLDRDQKQALSPRKMARGRFRRLSGGREMDEAVVEIDRGADVAAFGLGGDPFVFAHDLVNEAGIRRHGGPFRKAGDAAL